MDLLDSDGDRDISFLVLLPGDAEFLSAGKAENHHQIYFVVYSFFQRADNAFCRISDIFYFRIVVYGESINIRCIFTTC
jgi:hypothetical protein